MSKTTRPTIIISSHGKLTYASTKTFAGYGCKGIIQIMVLEYVAEAGKSGMNKI